MLLGGRMGQVETVKLIKLMNITEESYAPHTHAGDKNTTKKVNTYPQPSHQVKQYQLLT